MHATCARAYGHNSTMRMRADTHQRAYRPRRPPTRARPGAAQHTPSDLVPPTATRGARTGTSGVVASKDGRRLRTAGNSLTPAARASGAIGKQHPRQPKSVAHELAKTHPSAGIPCGVGMGPRRGETPGALPPPPPPTRAAAAAAAVGDVDGTAPVRGDLAAGSRGDSPASSCGRFPAAAPWWWGCPPPCDSSCVDMREVT